MVVLPMGLEPFFGDFDEPRCEYWTTGEDDDGVPQIR